MRRTAPIIAMSAAALLLSACGGADTAEEGSNDAATAGEAATTTIEPEGSDEVDLDAVEEDYEDEAWPVRDEPFATTTFEGADLTLILDATAEDSEVVGFFEQYREDVGGEPVSYIVTDVDNRNGSDLVNLYDISLYDADGVEYSCGDPDTHLEDNWAPIWLYGSTDEDEYSTADGEPMDYDTARELEQRARESGNVDGVSAFERNTMVSLCATPLPDEVVAVRVLPGGIVSEPIYAIPESLLGLDG